jgi:Copper type II ascorbate-dependent monooxygenase, C-terminal domain
MHRMRLGLPHALAGAVLALLCACSAPMGVPAVEADGGGKCGSGKARACKCDEGRTGVAQCLAGGDWGECWCGETFAQDGGLEAPDGAPDASAPDDGRVQEPLGLPKSGAQCEQAYEVRAHAASGLGDPYLIPGSGSLGLGPTVDPSVCFYFKAPYPLDSEALSFVNLPDEVSRPQQWLLYGVDQSKHTDGEIGPCSGLEASAYLLAAFTPGSDDLVMPSDVGLALPSGPDAGLILALRYQDPGQTELLDRSGVRICTSDKGSRAHSAAVHFTGSEAVCIPAGAQNYQVSGTCSPRTDEGDIHILSVWPHMHQLGTRMQMTIHRMNGTSELLLDQPYAFGAETHYAEDAVLSPGDTLETRCFYDNDRLAAVPYGKGATDEMCYGWVTAWPAGALSVDPNKLDALRSWSLGADATKRCLDPLGILGSCNGAADVP